MSVPATIECRFYGVDNSPDQQHRSHLFWIDPQTGNITLLGDVTRKDLEDVAIDMARNIIYASTGQDGDDDGYLYTVDPATGQLTPVGWSHYPRITALTVRPSDGTLWGWIEGTGLAQLDPTTGQATIVYTQAQKIEGMGWNPTTNLLYAAIGTTLYAYNPTATTDQARWAIVATNLPQNTESMKILPNGLLLGGAGSNVAPSVFLYDIQVGQVVHIRQLDSPYHSIEGLAWPDSCDIPAAFWEQ